MTSKYQNGSEIWIFSVYGHEPWFYSEHGTTEYLQSHFLFSLDIYGQTHSRYTESPSSLLNSLKQKSLSGSVSSIGGASSASTITHQLVDTSHMSPTQLCKLGKRKKEAFVLRLFYDWKINLQIYAMGFNFYWLIFVISSLRLWNTPASCDILGRWFDEIVIQWG